MLQRMTEADRVKAEWCLEQWCTLTGHDHRVATTRAEFASLILQLGMAQMNPSELAAWHLLRWQELNECPGNDELAEGFERDIVALGVAEMERQVRNEWNDRHSVGFPEIDEPMGVWLTGKVVE